MHFGFRQAVHDAAAPLGLAAHALLAAIDAAGARASHGSA